MSIAIAIVVSLMEHYAVMISQKLIIQQIIERIDKVRRHAQAHIGEDLFALRVEQQIPETELINALGLERSLDEIPDSKIRGIAKALCGINPYKVRSLEAGCRLLIAELQPASNEEREADEAAFRNNLMRLTTRYLALSQSERTQLFVTLEGTRTREQSETQMITELVKLRVDAEIEYERVLDDLRTLQAECRVPQEPLCDPRRLSEGDLKLHAHLYRDVVRQLKSQLTRADNRRHEQLQEAS